jgi:hypothetical protein
MQGADLQRSCPASTENGLFKMRDARLDLTNLELLTILTGTDCAQLLKHHIFQILSHRKTSIFSDCSSPASQTPAERNSPSALPFPVPKSTVKPVLGTARPIIGEHGFTTQPDQLRSGKGFAAIALARPASRFRPGSFEQQEQDGRHVAVLSGCWCHGQRSRGCAG